jgi:hypothetical protein
VLKNGGFGKFKGGNSMKKFLSIALALAMTLSLAVVGASATEYKDLTDKASIKHTEAVTVMNKIGIISGYSDGSFKPAASITRGAAAKIICMAKLGTTTANSLSTEAAPFKDVSTANTFAAFIAYCSNTKVVNGYNDGSFRPSESVTGYAFAKMLLTAHWRHRHLHRHRLGDQRGYCAAQIGLFDGIDSTVVMSKALSRDNACQMALNAMLYSKDTTTKTTTYYVVEGVAYTTFAAATTAAKTATNKTISQITVTEEVAVDSIGYKNFGLTKTTSGTYDSFGRPSVVYNATDWTDTLSYTKTPVVTYTTPVTEKQVFDDLGASGYSGSYAKFVVLTNLTEDGASAFTATVDTKTTVVTATPGTWSQNNADNAATIAKNDTTNMRGTGYGTTFEIYKVATNQYVAVSINQKLGTVTGVTKANANTGAARSITIDGTYTYTTDSFARGDTVLFTAAGTAAQSVVAPTSISGTVTKISSTGAYTIGGKDYYLSNRNTGNLGLTLNASGSWYVDAQGNIIGVKSATEATVYYGYLLGYACQDYNDNNLLGSGATEAKEVFKFVDSTGATKTLSGAFTTNSNGTVNKFVASAAGTATTSISGTSWDAETAKNKLFAYTLDSNGKIATVSDATTTNADAEKTLTKGTATFDGKYMSDSTVVFYVDDTNSAYAAYVGYSKAPTKTTAAEVQRHVGTGTAASPLKAVVLHVSDVAATTTSTYVYFGSTANTAETTTSGTVYTYSDVYVDGVKSTLKFSAAQSVAAGDLYDFTTNTTTKLSTLGNKKAASSNATALTSIQSTYFVAGSTYYTSSSTVYYLVDKTAGTVEKVSALTALSSAYAVNLIYTDATAGSTSSTAGVVYFSVD